MYSNAGDEDFPVTEEEGAVVRTILSRLGNPPEYITTGDLLDGWRRLVASLEKTYCLTENDYTNDLDKRHLLELILQEGPPPLRARLGKQVRELDAKFYASTFGIDKPLHGTMEKYDKERFPWYYRVPIRRDEENFYYTP